MITQEQLKHILHYDPDTGIFTWKINSGRAVKNKQAGSVNPNGYLNIKIDRKLYKAHRLAFLYIHGYLPDEVGHDNQEKTDNRIVNLIDLSHSENMKNKKIYKNNKSGTPGVTWHKRIKKWQAHIRVNNKSIHLGFFSDLNEAKESREKAKKDFNFHEKHH